MKTLNSMFKEKSNTAFNISGSFSTTIKQMHEQMTRLYLAAKELKEIVGQSAVARALNTSPQTVKNWESRGISQQGILDAAGKIGCSPLWLKSGDGEMSTLSSIEEGPDLRGRVPLISWVQAGAFSEAIDLTHPGFAEEFIDTTVKARSHTFALRVSGDSMEPDFPAGTILIVEPELEAHANDFVIVKNGAEEATFKQLVRDGSDWYLKPLNSRYPIKPWDQSIHIVGVVRASERKFR